MVEHEVMDVLRETAMKMTDYDEREAACWARGVVDGHAMANPAVSLERMSKLAINEFAQKAAGR